MIFRAGLRLEAPEGSRSRRRLMPSLRSQRATVDSLTVIPSPASSEVIVWADHQAGPDQQRVCVAKHLPHRLLAGGFVVKPKRLANNNRGRYLAPVLDMQRGRDRQGN